MNRTPDTRPHFETRGKRNIFCLLALVINGLAVCVATVVDAETGIVETQTNRIEQSSGTEGYGFKNGSVVVAPIPFANPTFGNGLAVGAAYLFNADEDSKPSVLGVGGFRSDNGSLGYGVSVNLALGGNQWLFNSLFATADLNYDLYTPLAPIPLRQKGTLARLSLAYGITPDVSFGGTLRYLDTTVSPDLPGLLPIPAPYSLDLGLELLSLGIIAQWDTRDDTVYPTSGTNLAFQAFHGSALSGGTHEYDKAFATFDGYLKLGQSGVLAARVALCGASQSTPFFDQCSLGGTDAFRGFSVTQFLDLRSASVQLEYRHQFTKRFGAAVFGGVGAAGPNTRNLNAQGLQSAGGVGVRYRVSKKFPVDFAIDGTRNNLGDQLVYIYVGQRF